jgi:hypothetical protein
VDVDGIRGADSTYVVRWQVWFGHVSGYVWTLFMFLLGRVEIWRMIRLMLLSRDEMGWDDDRSFGSTCFAVALFHGTLAVLAASDLDCEGSCALRTRDS